MWDFWKRKLRKYIIKAIETGTKKTKGKYECIIDRKEAIAKAIQIAKKADLVVIAGKGHEMYQEIGKEKIDFDERKIIKEIFEKQIKNTKKKK